jgi:lipopolysaccharide export system protein LptA
MKSTILFLFFVCTISIAAFSQKENKREKNFQIINADKIAISKDSIITTMTGNVDIKGKTFQFRNAATVVYNRKENILLVSGANTINADSLTLLKGDDGKEYIRYKLPEDSL